MVPVNVTLPPLRTSLPIDTAGGVVSSVRLGRRYRFAGGVRLVRDDGVGAVCKARRRERPRATGVGCCGSRDGMAIDSEMDHRVGIARTAQRGVRGILSVEDDPVSFDRFAVTPGATVSTWTVKAAEAALVSPCESVAALKLWVPSARAAVVKLQAPLEFAEAVPSQAAPSYSTTTLFAAAVPVTVRVLTLVIRRP